MVAVVLLLLVVAISLVTYVSAIVSASRWSEAAYKLAGRNKVSDVVLIVITGVVGGTYYWLVIRRELEPARVRQPKSFA